MSPILFKIVMRLVFVLVIVASVALYRRLTRPGALYEHPWARRVYLGLVLLCNVPWALGIVIGPGRPSFINRHVLTAMMLPALIFLLVQLAVGTVLLLRRALRPLFKGARKQTAPTAASEDAVPTDAAATAADLSRRQFLRRTAMAAPLVPFGVAVSGVALSQRRPAVRELRVPIPGLPAALHGFRVVQLSDIHVGPYITLDALKDYVTQANSLHADLFALTGDLVNHDPDQYADTARYLSQLKATHGAVAVLGNHEYYLGVEAPLECLPNVGIPLLRDGHQVLKHRGEELLVGLDYSFSYRRKHLPASKPADHVAKVQKQLTNRYAATVALTHHPHDFDALKRLRPNLTLAGHTHGGQLAIGQTSIANVAFRYTKGHYSDGSQHLYVNSGLGHWLPFRLGCPTEISVFTLVRA